MRTGSEPAVARRGGAPPQRARAWFTQAHLAAGGCAAARCRSQMRIMRLRQRRSVMARLTRRGRRTIRRTRPYLRALGSPQTLERPLLGPKQPPSGSSSSLSGVLHIKLWFSVGFNCFSDVWRTFGPTDVGNPDESPPSSLQSRLQCYSSANTAFRRRQR